MSKYLEEGVKSFLQNKNICLIGFMGSGKTYFGGCLAVELCAKLIDTDKMIEEHENKLIFDIFKEMGERYFRSVEKKILQDIIYSKNDDNTAQQYKVIVSGGGLPLKKANQSLLKQINTFYICLNPPFETVLERIRGSKRPLIYRRSRQSIFNLWSHRYKIYQSLADITIVETEIGEMFESLNQRINVYISSRRK